MSPLRKHLNKLRENKDYATIGSTLWRIFMLEATKSKKRMIGRRFWARLSKEEKQIVEGN